MSEINCFGDEIVYADVIPGWCLVQLVNLKPNRTRDYIVNGFVMNDGDFGLTNYNDPDFVFSVQPMLEPTEADSIDFVNEKRLFNKVLEHYRNRLRNDVNIGYNFVCDCIKAGYDPKKDYHIADWLLPRIYDSWKRGKIKVYHS
jgi:hypothetical protein